MPETEKLVSLKPEQIAIRDNIRFNLKPYRVDRLAEEILKDGGVNTPIEVQEVTEDGSKTYVLTAGHYRVSAVDKLNREQGADLSLPARVVSLQSETDRIMRQVSENNERENLSPMDKAIAMQRLIAAGVSKMDVRKVFAQPGGRKGLKIQPASNSFVNMTLSFLDFPKDIQKKIHEGLIGTGAAYELTKYPKDKWQAILDRVEADRIKGIDREEADEKKLLESEKEAAAKEQEAATAAAEYSKIKETAESAAKVAKEKAQELADAFQARLKAKGDEKKKANEHFKSVEAELKSAEDASGKAAKELQKLEDRRKAATEKADAARKRLEEARNAKKAGATTTTATNTKVGGTDVKKAAAKVDAKPAKVSPLNAAEMREGAKDLMHLSGGKVKTRAMGELLLSFFDRTTTGPQLVLGVSRLVGEEAPAKATPAPKK